MQKKNANEILIHLISLLESYLTELSDVSDAPDQQFVYGEKTAYVECLEQIAEWSEAEKHGLDFNIEDRFPLV